MPEHTPHHIDESRLLRMQVAAAARDINELTLEVGVLTDLVEFHREEAAQLRARLCRAEETLAEQVVPMPVEDDLDLEGVAA